MPTTTANPTPTRSRRPAAVRSPRPVTRRTRTFQRRRAAVLAAVIVVVAVGAFLLGVVTSSPAGAQQPAPAPVTVVVAPGDTVWELARDHRPDHVSVNEYAATVLAHNDLDATAVVPGTVVELPR